MKRTNKRTNSRGKEPAEPKKKGKKEPKAAAAAAPSSPKAAAAADEEKPHAEVGQGKKLGAAAVVT